MLRNWLVLAVDEQQKETLQDASSYQVVGSLKEVRVALLSGKYSGVVVLSISEQDQSGLSGFASSLKGHPELSKVQVIILDSLKSHFDGGDSTGYKFFSLDQISKLIDVSFSAEEELESGQGESRESKSFTELEDVEIVQESPVIGDNLEYLKHQSAKALARMVVENEMSGDREKDLEVFVRRVREH